ncbi:transcription termination factor Rho [Neoehrlichia mikurensis]|uniref:Transcription termination factor Rho n=1 Tax=Neoehrlichia mikurensis TaxID=89586 RepID=A0A9Q9F3K9_9RICK|nr:transcription termination factor Rho [Neoehrlichia mikurensis]QXK92195.1 transcription termination factor Rho [Neoehrlichia mikurensis]QXK92651.1 transcription termination factor Rho [Neoehrlichia mikurensis]QXK93888.1 transcription termination factor Rho [Neoehrlichia mikurensis]UTO55113.1 transcription termination factor Rho [Neoehrlichia mikurensis]UTO56033.1 transcription termination factor Rho [Neoehrlichia mikurensis]
MSDDVTIEEVEREQESVNEDKVLSKVLSLNELKRKSTEELLIIAEELGVVSNGRMLKQEIIFHLMKRVVSGGGVAIGGGVVEVLPDGFGFLRSAEANYAASSDDVYISAGQIKKFNLRTGDIVNGEIRAPSDKERYFTLVKAYNINFTEIGKLQRYVHFDDLIPLYPEERILLECNDILDKKDISMRAIDIIAPLGKGQRALIVAPPRAGKTIILQQIAHSISVNHPDMELMVLLIDERPEEVTDMLRSVKGEVVSSTFDEPAYRHVQLAEIVIEKAKRMVEHKKDVVILLDSITRLARAYNAVIPSSGKVLTGGVDSNALQRPKRFFGAARNIEKGGSLTIIATALIETGSKMDEVIFEEFKGTGNCEIILDRKIADKRIYPAIDISKSGTRKEDMLIDSVCLKKVWLLRRLLSAMGSIEAMEFLRDKLSIAKDNNDFFDMMNS